MSFLKYTVTITSPSLLKSGREAGRRQGAAAGWGVAGGIIAQTLTGFHIISQEHGKNRALHNNKHGVVGCAGREGQAGRLGTARRQENDKGSSFIINTCRLSTPPTAGGSKSQQTSERKRHERTDQNKLILCSNLVGTGKGQMAGRGRDRRRHF